MQQKQKRAREKRSILVAAGSEKIHTQGYGSSSLTDIAKRAKGPVGGVFYHFHTKADLAEAVTHHFGAMAWDQATNGIMRRRDVPAF